MDQEIKKTQSIDPVITIIGGPNGVGKSTLAESLFKRGNYINGDEIKRLAKLDLINLDHFSLRIHIRDLINSFVAAKESFAMESNLTSNYSYDIVRDLSLNGYFTQLIYIGVSDISLLNDRIAERVKLGKHYVSPTDVGLRYQEALSKLPINLKLFNEAVLVDNSSFDKPVEVLQLQDGIIVSSASTLPEWLSNIYSRIERLSNAYEKARSK